MLGMVVVLMMIVSLTLFMMTLPDRGDVWLGDSDESRGHGLRGGDGADAYDS